MPGPLTPIRIADDAFEIAVATPSLARALAGTLRSAGLAEDVVAGMQSVAVRFRPDRAAEIEAWLASLPDVPEPPPETAQPVEIHVHYGGEFGPDLDWISSALGLSPEAFIARHTEAVHTVEMMGFTPGFAYVSGLPGNMDIPRLDDPRPRVVAGSVGISAGFTGLYALDGPGGWPLVGRAVERLFDPASDQPFRLRAGQRLRFREV